MTPSRWYTDVDAYNNTFPRTLPLHRCTGTDAATDACAYPTQQAAGTYVYDSNYNRADGTAYGTPGIGYKGFWPLDDATGVSKFGQCNLGCTIDANCPTGSTCTASGNTQCSGTPPTHNFHFTSEVHHWFQFDTASLPKLTFRGDDDVWVFIAGKLVLDLGGTHPAVEGIVALRADGDADVTRPIQGPPIGGPSTAVVQLDLVNNGIYEIVVFQAERNTCESNYRLSLQNFTLRKSVCTPICGKNPDDSVTVTPPEECDDGNDNTQAPEYGKCTATTCELGPYCGDDSTNGPEECDSNGNRAEWGQSGCAPGCKNPPACGDGNIDTPFEECDLGSKNTPDGYNGCTKQCKIGPYCGDGAKNGDEVCDDGVNDNTYQSRTSDCSGYGPRCGDGNVDDTWGEECDDPNDENCGNCRLGAQCGDKIKQAGEACDDGKNDGGYGECAPGCKVGPHCGDGVVQSDFEQCDDGDNEGGYGKCKDGCVYDAHCGDGKVDKPYEECDDKNNKNGDGCSSACKRESEIPR